MIKDVCSQDSHPGHLLCRRKFAHCRAVWRLGLILFLFGVSAALAQPQSQREQAAEILGKFWEIVKGSLDSGPPPSLDDLKPIKEGFCKLFPDKCASFPRAGVRVYRFGGVYYFPYLSSSAIFYNHQKREAVLLPPRALSGIAKAAAYFEGQNWSPLQIASWLTPISPQHYSSMEASGDCYIYRSENGYVRIKYEGSAFTGKKVSIKMISESLPEKNQPFDKDDLKLDLKLKPMPAPATLCSHLDKLEAYWEGSFDL